MMKEANKSSKSKIQAKRMDLALLSYASQVLAHLPYNRSDDPLFIIHKINSIITLQGYQILERFADILRPVGLASGDELDDTNVSEDSLERAARSKFPSRTKEANVLSSRAFDTKPFEELCNQGASLILLLRLKGFLRRLYNLSETRCLEYNPSVKDKHLDKGVHKSDCLEPFDSSLIIGSVGGAGGSIDTLIRQYAEFRRMMREESMGSLDATAEGTEYEDGDYSSSRKRGAEDIAET
jgi:cohesin loading factor subunit SCC2